MVTDLPGLLLLWKIGKPNYGLLIWATNEDINGRDTRFISDQIPYSGLFLKGIYFRIFRIAVSL